VSYCDLLQKRANSFGEGIWRFAVTFYFAVTKLICQQYNAIHDALRVAVVSPRLRRTAAPDAELQLPEARLCATSSLTVLLYMK
jgi:hypothetical protein